MGNPNIDRRKLRTSVFRVLRTCRACCNALLFQVTSFLVAWALTITSLIVRRLYVSNAKLRRRPVSLDLLVLQNMLDIAETLPQFRLRSKVRRHSSPQPILRRIQESLFWFISLPIEGARRLSCRILRSLYSLDQKLHQRTPQILSVLKNALYDAKHTLRFVQKLKS